MAEPVHDLISKEFSGIENGNQPVLGVIDGLDPRFAAGPGGQYGGHRLGPLRIGPEQGAHPVGNQPDGNARDGGDDDFFAAARVLKRKAEQAAQRDQRQQAAAMRDDPQDQRLRMRDRRDGGRQGDDFRDLGERQGIFLFRDLKAYEQLPRRFMRAGNLCLAGAVRDVAGDCGAGCEGFGEQALNVQDLGGILRCAEPKNPA